ncbi:MAG: NUDIX domain-containing protein [Betaproteobacteria bacterium]|nr:NUDIX domain-containing protein [Betaproteobacteria bacterium]
MVVAHRHPDGWRFLVLRAFRNWDFPKGLVEPAETPLEAAIRETREETSLAGLQFRWGEAYRETEPYRRGKVARFYLAESPSAEVTLPVNPELGWPEHHEFRWATREQAAKLLPPRLLPILEWASGVVSSPPRPEACPPLP